MNEKTKQLLLRFAPEKSRIPNKPEDANWGYQMSRDMVESAIAKGGFGYIPWKEVNEIVSAVEDSKGAVELVKFNVYEGYLQGCLILEWFTLETRRFGNDKTSVRTDYYN